MPCDHLISNKEKFLEAISNIEKNLTSNYWVTLGVKPTKPSEAYGYIKASISNKKTLFQVTNFIEKPSKKVAAELICTTRTLECWNFYCKCINNLHSTKHMLLILQIL